jgi:uncharacterized protein
MTREPYVSGKVWESIEIRPCSRGPAHIALGDEMISRSEMLYGVAILNDAGEMAGSMLSLDFASQADLDAWQAKEPYIAGRVWESVDIHPCRVGPSLQGLHRSTGELLVR